MKYILCFLFGHAPKFDVTIYPCPSCAVTCYRCGALPRSSANLRKSQETSCGYRLARRPQLR